ncbi:hypothetical protein BH24PSE2_BH24PSE2_01050 [soil metagenome]
MMLRNRVRLATLFLLAAWLATAASADGASRYELDYRIELVPKKNHAEVTVALGDNADLVREIRFRIEPARHSGFEGDGQIEVDERYVHWTPPPKGGRLRFTATIDHRRGQRSFDALMTDEWGIFRGDDLVPPARVRTAAGAEARSRLKLTAPRGWGVVTPYPEAGDGWLRVEHDDRRFDRPTGWMAAGKLGVRREHIRGVQVAVAGPVGHGVRRLDTLAFLNWNLPELLRVFDEFHDTFIVVSAGDPMWRGGLSGPASIYLHADRPLISENGTSTLMHELVHAAMGIAAESGSDWIVEGLAEFYTLELMRRSGTITRKRYDRGYEQLREWSGEVLDLKAEHSKGATTARAVLIMRALDDEIRQATEDDASLDDVARTLAERGKRMDLEALRKIAADVMGRPAEALSDERLRAAPDTSALGRPGKARQYGPAISADFDYECPNARLRG